MFKKRIRGFTLIELLVTIAVLGLILLVSAVFVFKSLNNSKQKIDVTSKKLIVETVEDYVLEFNNSENWKEHISNDGKTRTFCVSLESLSNYGFYKENNEIFLKFKDDYIVKGTVNNGVYNYEIIEKSSMGDQCSYYQNGLDLSDSNISNDLIEDETDLGDFKLNITKNDNNMLNANISLDIDVMVNEYVSSKPVYVVLIVDNSSSMNWPSVGDTVPLFEYAKDATIELSEKILEKIPNAQIALVTYNTFAKLGRDFDNKPILETDLVASTETANTNTAAGIDYASALIKKIKSSENYDEDSSFYTILLYDGVPDKNPAININSTSNTINSFNYAVAPSNIPSYIKNNFYLSSLSSTYVENYFNNFPYGVGAVSCAFKQYNNILISQCMNSLTFSSNYLKNTLNSKLVVIGYEIDPTRFSEPRLITAYENAGIKRIATSDPTGAICNNTNYTGYCYYDASTSNIFDKFNIIYEQVLEIHKNTDAKSVTVRLTPKKQDNGDNYFVILKDGNPVDDNIIEISENIGSLFETKKITLNENYELKIPDDVYSVCTENCNLGFTVELIFKYDDKEDLEIVFGEYDFASIGNVKVEIVN